MSVDYKGQRFCDECGRLIAKAHRIENDKEYCSSCYPRVFPPRPCTTCEGTARSHRFVSDPVCGKCLRKDRKCLRCDKQIPRAGLRVGTKYACKACAVHFLPAVMCPGCGNKAQSLSRVNGQGEAVCNSCRNRANNVTCARCRKFRLATCFVDGRAYCAACVPGEEMFHSCPNCGEPVPGTGEAPCLRCYNRRKVQSSASLAVSGLERPWSRTLLEQYGRWLCAQHPTKIALYQLFEKHVPFFVRIDTTFAEPCQITSQSLLDHLGSAYLRQYLLASRFLQASLQVPVDRSARQRVAEHATIEKLMVQAKRAQVDTVVQRYAVWLNMQGIALRTQRLYLSSAVAFAIRTQLQPTQEPEPHALEIFLKERPGLRANLTKFTRFTRDVLGWELRAEPARASNKRPVTVRRMQTLLAKLPAGNIHHAQIADLIDVLALALGFPKGALAPYPQFTRDQHRHFVLHHGSEQVAIPEVLQPVAETLWMRRP